MPEPDLLLIRSSDVATLLPVQDCIGAMEEAFKLLASGQALQPVRQVVTVPGGGGALYSMPCHLGAAEDGVLGVKLVTLFPGNTARGYETHNGVIVLFDGASGRPVAIIEAGSVTAIRTAAVSALATSLLSADHATDLAILGSGVQARSHLEAMLIVRPVRRVRVWNRTTERATTFAREMSDLHSIDVTAVRSAEAAVRGAHIICCVTGATEPIVHGEWVEPGAHVNAVGASTPSARELDSALVSRARVIVDSREAALAEAGDLLIPMREGVIGADHVRADLAELVAGQVNGRLQPGDVTIFKSLGLAIEDAAAARAIHARALAAGWTATALD